MQTSFSSDCVKPRPGSVQFPSLATAQLLAEQLAAAAQQEYDDWDETDVDTYAGGGICHLIAERLVGILDQAGIEACSVSSSHEQHVYVACQLAEGVVTLDVPHYLYERGAGFSWTKLPGVIFTANSLAWYTADTNPDAYLAYVES
jgi:hypothetical protein